MSTMAPNNALGDRYRLEAEIGRGGMGVVYRANDTLLKRDVAIKVLSVAALGSHGRTRLLHEAQAVAKLNHPNIVSVYDAGEALIPGQSHAAPFIVMELVVGKSLYDERPQSIGDVIKITRQICLALEHAHANGIVHRDLKPENVLLVQDSLAGTNAGVKLVDFGLARSVASRVSVDGGLVGTVFYVAPEQVQGNEVDGRADLYALGVMLYEVTTGRLPFTADDPVAVITQHLYAPVVPPRAKNAEIPPALDQLIVRLLSKTPQDRPASASDVLALLEHLEKPDGTGVAPSAEELPLLDRFVRGRLVGREQELSHAWSMWRQAVAGDGQTLLISGEPGIGKTRLVRELVTRVQVSGGLALTGTCYAEGGGPYAPFAQLLSSALQIGATDNLDLPEFVLADLVTLAPMLRLHFPDLPPNPSLDPHAEQQRQFESVVAFCSALSAQAPLLIVLEDAHWADSGTLTLLRHLVRRTRRQRLLIVASYRELELDEAQPFHDLLLDLQSERLARRLKLPRLSREATGDLLAALLDEEITPDFLDGIYRETEGNPFFIEEVCKALVESGELYFAAGRWHRPSVEELGIPQSLRVAIQSRVGKLPTDTQETLRLAAILGREFDFVTLMEASELDEDRLLNALEQAERAQLIEEISSARGGTFSFVHALIPTTIADGLSGLRRRRIHRQVAAAIESVRPDDWEALAYHALESGNLRSGIDYALRAADRALRLFALGEALHHASRALEAAETLGLAGEIVEILELVGDIHAARGTKTEAVQAYGRALESTTARDRGAILKSKIGTAYAIVGDERGVAYLQTATQELDHEEQANSLAMAIASMGRFYHYRGQHGKALDYLDRALALAKRIGDPDSISLIYAYLAGAHQHLAEFDQSMEWARRSLALGERADRPSAVAMGYEFLAEDSFALGKWQAALNFAEQDRHISEQIGKLAGVAWAELSKMHAFYGLGDLPSAAAAGFKALEMAETIGDFRLTIIADAQLSIVQTDVGDAEQAREHAERATAKAGEMDQVYMICTSRDALAYWHVQRGDFAAATDVLEKCACALANSDSRLVPLVVGQKRAEAYIGIGRLDEADDIVTRTLGLATEAKARHFEAVLHRVRGQLFAARGAWDEAHFSFVQAIATLDELGSRLELARALYHRGGMERDQGERAAAHASLTRALELFQACSAAVEVERARTALGSLESGEWSAAEHVPIENPSPRKRPPGPNARQA
jgi:tetratricopeptide (TPR) repeat protein